MYGASVTPRAGTFAERSPFASTPPGGSASLGSAKVDKLFRRAVIECCDDGDLFKLQSLYAAARSDDDGTSISNLALTKTGLTALHLTAGRGHVEMIKWLVESGRANVEVEDCEREVSPVPSSI